jgi:hypothetical protein
MAGAAAVPDQAWSHWNGRELARRGLRPKLSGVALSNALPFCPTKDGLKFCAPSRAQLLDAKNLARMIREVRRAARRCRGTLSVIALGRKAELLLAQLSGNLPSFTLRYLPHPSARALASSCRGRTIAAAEREWRDRLLLALKEATPTDG